MHYKKIAQQIHDEAGPIAKKLTSCLKEYLKTLIVRENSPNNPIVSITHRVKSPASIVEKSAARGIETKSALKNLGDIIGARIILNDAAGKKGIKSGDIVLEKITEMVKDNKLKIVEIENYRPDARLSYASKKSMLNLEAESASRAPKDFASYVDKIHPAGYTAIHLEVKLDNNITGEIQIMGKRVEALKEIEDILYKLKCGKEVPAKYKPIANKLSNLKDANDDLLRAVNVYTKNQYTHARQMELTGKDLNKYNNFLRVPPYLPSEFDFNEIATLKMRCDLADAMTNTPTNKLADKLQQWIN